MDAIENDDEIRIITIGRWFPKSPQKLGIWSAELLWIDDNGLPSFEQLKDRQPGATHMGMDVVAVLAGLRVAKELNRPALVRSVNESVVLTMSEYLPYWKSHNWKTTGRDTPKNLKEWQEIDSICQDIRVTWEKRPKEAVDIIKDYEALWEELENRQNQLAMERAIARDPFG